MWTFLGGLFLAMLFVIGSLIILCANFDDEVYFPCGMIGLISSISIFICTMILNSPYIILGIIFTIITIMLFISAENDCGILNNVYKKIKNNIDNNK